MTKKVLILGGGLTGMVTSFKLANDCDVTLVEKEKELGGKTTTRFVESTDGLSFRFDVGGHWLHNKGFLEVKDMFTGLKKHQRHAYVHLNGQYAKFPVQAFYDDVFDEDTCRRIEQEVGQDQSEPESYDDMLRKSYGQTLFDAFFAPYNRKLFGLEDLTRISVGKLELVRNVRVGDKSGYNDEFLYPDGKGISSLAMDMWSDKVTYLKEHEMTSLDTIAQRAYFSNGTVIDYDVLVSTIPLKNLLERQDNPNLREEREGLDHSVGRIVNLGLVKRETHEGKTWVYYADESLPFYRVGFYSNVDATAAPEGYSSAYVEVSTLKDASMEEILDGLQSVGMIESHEDVIVSEDVTLPFNYCFVNEQTVPLRERLVEQNIYSIGRYGSWHWSSMHQDVQQALATAEEIKR